MAPYDFPDDVPGDEGGGGATGSVAVGWTLAGTALDAGDYALTLVLDVTIAGAGTVTGSLRYTNADGLQTVEVVSRTLGSTGVSTGDLRVYLTADSDVEFSTTLSGGATGTYTVVPRVRPIFLPRFSGLAFELYDGADTTKRVRFDASTVPTGTVVALQMPAADGQLALLTDISGGALPDADYGDISVASGVMTIDAGVVTAAKTSITGTPDSTKYLRDDWSWQAVAGGSGDNVTVNGVALVDADLDDATPAAGAGDLNVKWQKDASSPANVSAYVDVSALLNIVWPVGHIIINENSTNPGTVYGFGTWANIAAGRVLVGLDSGDTDFDVIAETGGAKTVAAAGSNAAEAAHTHSVTSNVAVAAHTPTQPTIAWPAGVPTAAGEAAHTHGVTSNVAIGNEAAHTHTYTQTLDHVHVERLQGGTTGTTTGTNLMGSAATGGSLRSAGQSTLNPTGSAGATGTTSAGSSHTHTPTNNAVTSAAGSSHTHTLSWPAGVPTASGGGVDAHGVTNNAVASGAGSSHNHAFTGSATSVVQPYYVVYYWKRTA